MRIDEETVQKAYKKLKSSVYFDKTQLILRDKIVRFEEYDILESGETVDDRLKRIYEQLIDAERFQKLSKRICDSVSVLSYPKKIVKDESNVIMNSVPRTTKVKELQSFINMKVEGHILGVLWVMLVGYKIDQKIYEHSYGNRIRKNLINELSDNPTYSPYLFEPYFEQYESWRDKALTIASKHMDMKQDVTIITMDFRRYYYSVDMDRTAFDTMCEDAFSDGECEYYEEYKEIIERLNDFIFDVISSYSRLFSEQYKGRNILPIGFMPSNVIGNWCLKNFDKAVVNGWNPLYYGRYVDDVLIVDKVEHNSDIYNKAKSNDISRELMIEFFLKKCTKWIGLTHLDCDDHNDYALIKCDDMETKKETKEQNNPKDCIYNVNPRYNPIPGNNSEIIVQNDKVKIFYFRSGETDALIQCFRENIARNKSEFRFLPEDNAVFQEDDYSEIYTLNSSDTINKFRGIDGVSLDKFALSKFLGKYLRIGGLIEDKVESGFEKDILKIFNYRAIIENYTTWEKIIEIFTINEHFDAVKTFVNRIIDAIKSVEYEEDNAGTSAEDIKKTLYECLHCVLLRTLALVWKDEVKELQDKIFSNEEFKKSIQLKYDIEYLEKDRMAYCKTYMIDKSVMPIMFFMLSKEKLFSGTVQVNLARFNEVLDIAMDEWSSDYKYYPYMVNMYDFCMSSCIDQLKKEYPFSNMREINIQQKYMYIKSNYNTESIETENDNVIINKIDENGCAYLVSVGHGKKPKLRIAIANVKLSHGNFERLVRCDPDRSYKRYHDLSLVVNQAIEQKADMLIMPEAFVPYEWLSTLARTCARNNVAVVTGVEHIKYNYQNKDENNNKIYNFTAVILPYSEDRHKCAYISFHLKKHYSPGEKDKIRGYRLTEVNGNHYELYKWNDCYFPVYCCYELASIQDRALFQSYADMLIAVEWNKDTNYYSNIMESLSRDIHCYCIQVNSSNYGDSRITQPSKTEEKDIIRTKGGINNTILVGEVDIDKLRDFQYREYNLQQDNKTFKTTPPDFKPEIITKKIKGEDIFGK